MPDVSWSSKKPGNTSAHCNSWGFLPWSVLCMRGISGHDPAFLSAGADASAKVDTR
jgi:hypothetical protein